jgi:hypothetical protein
MFLRSHVAIGMPATDQASFVSCHIVPKIAEMQPPCELLTRADSRPDGGSRLDDVSPPLAAL